MRTTVLCIISSTLASAMVLWASGQFRETESTAHADGPAIVAPLGNDGETNRGLVDDVPPFPPEEDDRPERGPVIAPAENPARTDRLALPNELDPVETLPNALTPDEKIAIAVYESANASVVNITTRSGASDRGPFVAQARQGSGSGTVIDADGHILTNFHVVEDADEIEVTLADGSTHEAEVMGIDPLNDLAVIRIEVEPNALRPVTFTDSTALKVGMRVFAIGNPFGLERTMTTGIISSLNRTLPSRNHRSIRQIIQIDAAVNPGNSGGPLLDARGRLIGINVAIASKTGQSAGVGFAIPANLVRRVAADLIEYGKFIRPDTGIRRVFEVERGILIEELDPDGPAARAGLRGPKVERSRRGPYIMVRRDRSVADLILGVDNLRTPTADDFLTYIESKGAGDRVTIRILRDGKMLEVPITLSSGE